MQENFSLELIDARNRNPVFVETLLGIWERSAAASHTFLSPGEIADIRPEAAAAIEVIPDLVIARSESGTIIGFLGVNEEKIELLFVRPESFGQGVGSRLTVWAVSELGARAVDVNEQNPAALGFYEHIGFVSVGRNELDGAGRPYPIIRMLLAEPQG